MWNDYLTLSDEEILIFQNLYSQYVIRESELAFRAELFFHDMHHSVFIGPALDASKPVFDRPNPVSNRMDLHSLHSPGSTHGFYAFQTGVIVLLPGFVCIIVRLLSVRLGMQ